MNDLTLQNSIDENLRPVKVAGQNSALEISTENARVNGSLFLNGGQGLTKVSGHYGTVSTTGNGNGNHEGYSIDNRYVFMSPDNNSCGLYNDVDNKWILKP